MKQSIKLYLLMTIGALVGVIAAFWQTLDKLSMLKDPAKPLVCDINDVFACNNVLNAPQSSVFGFPNSIMCLMLFVIFFSVALVGLTGGQISKKMRLGVQFLSLFTLGFAFWFLFESTYRIGAICIFCLFCFLGLLVVNATWLRLNSKDLPYPHISQNLIRHGTDILIWILMAVLVFFAILFRFYA